RAGESIKNDQATDVWEGEVRSVATAGLEHGIERAGRSTTGRNQPGLPASPKPRENRFERPLTATVSVTVRAPVLMVVTLREASVSVVRAPSGVAMPVRLPLV